MPAQKQDGSRFVARTVTKTPHLGHPVAMEWNLSHFEGVSLRRLIETAASVTVTKHDGTVITYTLGSRSDG